jgi:hypothetical protein
MTRAKGSSRRKRAKSDQPARAPEQNAVIDTDRLLEEVEEANAHIADPAEREQVIPSRPCDDPGTHHHGGVSATPGEMKRR